MKLYIIQWGYHSCLDGGSELDSIWTNKIWGRKYLRDKATGRHLKKKRGDGDYYTNGDYWISMSEVNSDSEYMYDRSE